MTIHDLFGKIKKDKCDYREVIKIIEELSPKEANELVKHLPYLANLECHGSGYSNESAVSRSILLKILEIMEKWEAEKLVVHLVPLFDCFVNSFEFDIVFLAWKLMFKIKNNPTTSQLIDQLDSSADFPRGKGAYEDRDGCIEKSKKLAIELLRESEIHRIVVCLNNLNDFKKEIDFYYLYGTELEKFILKITLEMFKLIDTENVKLSNSILSFLSKYHQHTDKKIDKEISEASMRLTAKIFQKMKKWSNAKLSKCFSVLIEMPLYGGDLNYFASETENYLEKTQRHLMQRVIKEMNEWKISELTKYFSDLLRKKRFLHSAIGDFWIQNAMILRILQEMDKWEPIKLKCQVVQFARCIEENGEISKISRKLLLKTLRTNNWKENELNQLNLLNTSDREINNLFWKLNERAMDKKRKRKFLESFANDWGFYNIDVSNVSPGLLLDSLEILKEYGVDKLDSDNRWSQYLSNCKKSYDQGVRHLVSVLLSKINSIREDEEKIKKEKIKEMLLN